MTEDRAKTVTRPHRHEIAPVKGSRFVADLAPATTDTGARQLLHAVRSEFADASHHCSAWRLAMPMIERADDGEPRGSAGRPILAQLTGRNVIDVAVIVVDSSRDGG